MSIRNRIPQSLDAYLRLPPELSLLLITGTLGCSPNWLTSRVVGSIINGQQDSASVDDVEPTAVVLVSWMRDAAYWKSELRRSMGLDTSKLRTQDRIALIDCLTPNPSTSENGLSPTSQTILAAIQNVSANGATKIHLILDEPAILLATAATTTHDLNKVILQLRSKVHSTTIITSADLPFLSAAQGSVSTQPPSGSTPLETETAAFVVQQAHNARLVMSCRELATGAARDVSGVMRVTRGGDAYSTDDSDERSAQDRSKGYESLYLVNRDGSVKVFERGSES